jgi:hypothetical protein
MTFYNILWITIFSLGGISLGLLGLFELNYFSVLLINPSMFNGVIGKTEEIYLNSVSSTAGDSVAGIKYQTQRI